MKKSLFILISILTLSCNSDDTATDKTSLKLVTGVNFRQTPEDIPLQLGNPNILTDNKFVMYPNPAKAAVNILAQENITEVWVVKANPEKIHQNIEFDDILNSNLYSEQLINSNSDLFLNEFSSNEIMLTLGELEKGYYKVFVKINGVIYWDNLYKNDTQGGNEEELTSIINFWN